MRSLWSWCGSSFAGSSRSWAAGCCRQIRDREFVRWVENAVCMQLPNPVNLARSYRRRARKYTRPLFGVEMSICSNTACHVRLPSHGYTKDLGLFRCSRCLLCCSLQTAVVGVVPLLASPISSRFYHGEGEWIGNDLTLGGWARVHTHIPQVFGSGPSRFPFSFSSSWSEPRQNLPFPISTVLLRRRTSQPQLDPLGEQS